MNKLDLILIGAGGHAEACIDVIEQNGRFQVVGLIGQPHEINDEHFGYAVIADDSALPKIALTCRHALIVVGQILSPEPRRHLYYHASQLGFVLPVIISPAAYISPRAVIGPGTIVMHGAIVNAGATIGKNCIVNSCALVEHGCSIGDHCHVSTGAVLNGDVRVNEGTFIGSGAIVREQVEIGRECVIGMGSCVRHDIPAETTYKGYAKSRAHHS